MDDFTKFVLAAYWGIYKEDDTDTIIIAAIKKAYTDASRRVLALDKSIINEKSNTIFMSIKNYPEIYKKHEKVTAESYDEWHKLLCNELIMKEKGTKDKSCLNIGHAQKWVNMTIKYLWLLSLLLDLNEVEILKAKNSFHIPVDSFILEGLKNEERFSNVDPNNSRKKLITGSGDSYAYMGKTWSSITEYKEYFSLQEKVRNEIKPKEPLVYENDLWIKISVKRQNGGQKKENK